MNVVGVELWQAATAALGSVPRLLIVNTITALCLVAISDERPRKWRMAVIFVVVCTSVQLVSRVVWP